jgi:hypothetical protein
MPKQREVLPSVTWSDLVERFPGQVIALEVLEVTPNVGMTKGALIAAGTDDSVWPPLNAFVAANPGKQYAIFDTGAETSDLDIILSCP